MDGQGSSNIPPRNLILDKTTGEEEAYEQIKFWVREQAVKIDGGDIRKESDRLFILWKKIPDGSQQVQFIFKGKGISAGHRYLP